MTQKTEFDVIVVGAGPGGYVAAIRAAQLGFDTAIVEEQQLGGVCLNWGCIPTKALLQSAECYQKVCQAADFGVNVTGVSFDLDKMVERSRAISERLTSGVAHLLKKNKVSVFNGFAQLNQELVDGKRQLLVKEADNKTTLIAPHIILATGARARTLPHFVTEHPRVWCYKQALVPQKIPKSMLVIGSGAIGIEFANFYHALGCQVTVVEVLNQIMPNEDTEIAQLAQQQMEQRGMVFKLASKVTQLEPNDSCVKVQVESNAEVEQLDVEQVICAVGVSPNIEGLVCDGNNLTDIGIELDKSGFIVTDGYGQTSIKGIYAIGDVAGAPCLAHKASHEGIICVEHIANKTVYPLDKTMIPNCTYCTPQVASIGLTESQAKNQGLAYQVGRFPYQANGKAIAQGQSDGMVKVIFEQKTGELLGAHLVGSEATELIAGLAIAKNLETTEQELIETVFPHPTLSEMLHESVLDAFERVIHF